MRISRRGWLAGLLGAIVTPATLRSYPGCAWTCEGIAAQKIEGLVQLVLRIHPGESVFVLPRRLETIEAVREALRRSDQRLVMALRDAVRR